MLIDPFDTVYYDHRRRTEATVLSIMVTVGDLHACPWHDA
jgi:hypothetical protein